MYRGQRPDFSNYVAHFAKDASPFGAAANPDDSAFELTTGSAHERLVSILKTRRLVATPMPWTGRRAVAFTECPWWSMLDHARQYSATALVSPKLTFSRLEGVPLCTCGRIYSHVSRSTSRCEMKPSRVLFRSVCVCDALRPPVCTALPPRQVLERSHPSRLHARERVVGTTRLPFRASRSAVRHGPFL